MDQKRLMLAIALSVAILVVFQMLLPHPVKPPVPTEATTTAATAGAPGAAPGALPATPAAVPDAEARDAPRLKIAGPRVQGSINLLGARFDDLVLRDYHDTIDPTSPLVQVLVPRVDKFPNFVQFGWSAPAGTADKLPDSTTLWQADGDLVGPGKPVTLHWDNGAGLTFELAVTVDDNFMFNVVQRVRNATGAPVALFPWSRVSRDYTPVVAGTYVLHEGLVGWFADRLQEQKYAAAKTESVKNANDPEDPGFSLRGDGTSGWAGITDKYWLTALVPDQAVPTRMVYRHSTAGGGDSYQVYARPLKALEVPPGGSAEQASRMFAGAKEVRLLNHYEEQGGIVNFSYAVDWGWFFFLTKPFFLALDWLNSLFHNFGVAILVFTVLLKGLFFPLANYSYRSMSKMKLLGPKMTALREQYKDEPAKLQSAMMGLYKQEKVNPASGCLPMLIQIPVFFSLYKVIYTTIEMRHAPFFGWIHDLSAIDPTNVFNLFGLIPFDPGTITPFLHLGVWPLIMGATMFFQQKLNPPPPDPVQAKVFQFMPLIFTFMLASFPAGLVIYWSWNNTLTIGQQWLIMRRTHLSKPSLAKV